MSNQRDKEYAAIITFIKETSIDAQIATAWANYMLKDAQVWEGFGEIWQESGQDVRYELPAHDYTLLTFRKSEHFAQYVKLCEKFYYTAQILNADTPKEADIYEYLPSKIIGAEDNLVKTAPNFRPYYAYADYINALYSDSGDLFDDFWGLFSLHFKIEVKRQTRAQMVCYDMNFCREDGTGGYFDCTLVKNPQNLLLYCTDVKFHDGASAVKFLRMLRERTIYG